MCLFGIFLNVQLLQYIEIEDMYLIGKGFIQGLFNGTEPQKIGSFLMDGPLQKAFPGKAFCDINLTSRMSGAQQG